jgi:hypothetical protein
LTTLLCCSQAPGPMPNLPMALPGSLPLPPVPKAVLLPRCSLDVGSGEVRCDNGLVDVLTCPSTGAAWALLSILASDKAPVVRVLLAWPVERAPAPIGSAPAAVPPGDAGEPLEGQHSFKIIHGAAPVVVKVYQRKPATWKGIDDPATEIAAMHALSSPGHKGVAPMLACIRDKRYLYIVSEYYAGGDLCEFMGERLKRGVAGLEAGQACDLFTQTLDALQYMHRHRIAHRLVAHDNKRR